MSRSHERRDESKRLIALAEAQGFTTKQKKDGVMVLGKDGVSSCMLHHTSSDHRSIKNNKAALRRIGVEC